MKNNIIETKREIYWYFVSEYLSLLTHVGIACEDKVFREKLADLQQYVDGKLEVDGDILETYVTVLQKAGE